MLSFISSRRGSKNNIASPPTPPSDSSVSPVKTNGFDASLPQEVPAPASRDNNPTNGKKPDRGSSRPVSTLLQQQQQLPSMDAGGEALPELEPILSYLNNQSGKLYYEGYFFKLNDLDNRACSCVYSMRLFWLDC